MTTSTQEQGGVSLHEAGASTSPVEVKKLPLRDPGTAELVKIPSADEIEKLPLPQRTFYLNLRRARLEQRRRDFQSKTLHINPIDSTASLITNPLDPTASAIDNQELQTQLQSIAQEEQAIKKERDKIAYLKNNYGTRASEVSSTLGGVTRDAFFYEESSHTNYNNSNQINFQTQVGTFIDNGGGFLIALIIQLVGQYYYRNSSSYNPLYRNLKTLAAFGSYVATVLTFLLPIPNSSKKIVNVVITDITSLLFGLIAIPYWYVREKILQIPQIKRPDTGQKPERNDLTGQESWSKYVKTALVFFCAVGQMFAGLWTWLGGGNLLVNLAIGGGVTAVIGGLSAFVIVPLINRSSRFKQALVTKDKDSFRNNYIRTGITFGTALGAALGFVIGTFLCPGIGSLAGMTLFGAIGATIGGSIFGKYGGRISLWIKRVWGGADDSSNSWDYATRSNSYFVGYLFMAIFAFLPIPGGVAVGAIVGNAVGTAVGWLSGLVIVNRAAKISTNTLGPDGQPLRKTDDQNNSYIVREEKLATYLNWSQRLPTGCKVGAFVGGVIGFAIGMAFGGLPGAILGSAIGTGLGGVIGGIIGVMIDKIGRQQLWKGIKSFFSATETAPDTPTQEQQQRLTSTVAPPGPSSVPAEQRPANPATVSLAAHTNPQQPLSPPTQTYFSPPPPATKPSSSFDSKAMNTSSIKQKLPPIQESQSSEDEESRNTQPAERPQMYAQSKRRSPSLPKPPDNPRPRSVSYPTFHQPAPSPQSKRCGDDISSPSTRSPIRILS